jgi:sugar phosphate isomerase/epimerase
MKGSMTSRREFFMTAAAAGGLAALPRSASAEEKKGGPHRYKISCAAYSYRQYLPSNGKKGEATIFDFVDLCSQWGCDGTEPTTYYFEQTDAEYLHKLKRQAFLHGLDVTSTAVGNNFCFPPGDELTKQINDVKAWIDRSVEFGAPVIRIFGGHERKGLDRQKAFQCATDAMKHVCDYAGQRGVFLGIENHGYLTERADDIMKILDTVNHPWLAVNLDTGNFVDKPYENIAVAAPRAVTCQIKVQVRTDDGKGWEPADIPRIVGIMRKVNYQGYLVLEYEGREEPKTAIPMWLEKIRQAAS